MIFFKLELFVKIKGGRFYSTTKVYGYIKKTSIKESYLFWLGLFNSSLFWYFIQQTGYVLRGGYFTFKTNYIMPFPVPNEIPIHIVSEIEMLVENILSIKENMKNANTSFYEKQIDEYVYQLYNIDKEEVELTRK